MSQILRGGRNQCPACGQYFNSISIFEKHRTGAFGTGPLGTSPERRCFTIREMKAKGWKTDEKGFWSTPGPSGSYWKDRNGVANRGAG